jgi:mRNA interferase MazF
MGDKQEILKGDVYFCDLGESIYSEQKGKRPVLIVQNDFGNKYSPTTIVCPITSDKENKPKLPTHIKLCKEQFSFLKYDSIILTEQVRAIDKRRLKDCVGRIDDNVTMIKVENALQIGFGMFT